LLASGASITLLSDGVSKWLPKSQSHYFYAEGNNNSGNLKPVAGGTGSVAIGRGAYAGGSPSFSAGANSGFSGSSANAAGSTALGGSYASGTDSFAAAIANNSSSYGATGANSVAIGQLAKASGVFSTSVGYGTQSTSGNSMAFGRSSVASGNSSLALGYGAAASGERSVAIGNNAKATTYGKMAYAAADFGSSSLYSQMGTYVLLVQTTDATPSVLTSTRFSPSFDNQIILPNNSAYAFHGTIVARQKASTGTACAAWKIEGLIRMEANAASTVLVNSALTVLDNTPAWGLALTADTTNGGLKIEVTGAAATNIRWVATINTSEVTYA
jgi:hypothetical protein